MKQNNQCVGNVSFGFQLSADGQHLEANRAEQVIIAKVRELKDAGFALRQIAGELNRQGYMTRRGSAWRHQYVSGVLNAAA